MANQYRSVLAGAGGTGGDAVASEVLSGKTFTNDNGPQTGTMVDRGAVSQTLSAGQSYTVPEGYHNGSGVVTAVSEAYIARLGTTNALTKLTSGANNFTGVLASCYIACGDNFSSLAVTISGGSYTTGFIFKKDGTSQQITASTFTLDCSDTIGAIFEVGGTQLTFNISAT